MKLSYINKLSFEGKKIGITFSQFDLLHAGHTLMLAEAKAQCDFLICGIQNNANMERPGKNSPIQSIIERQFLVCENKSVDDIIIYNTEDDIETILMTIPIDIRFIGSEYKNIQFTGREICIKKNIKLVFNIREHNFSSSNLRSKIINSNI
jgi:glycerol-3-phosphate cytidylyltransferase